MSWHYTASTYTASTSVGIASPSYKFGLDTVFVISPQFAQADTVTFWCKGFSISGGSRLNIYSSNDSVNWTMFVSNTSLPSSGAILKYAIPYGAKWVMFVYRKVSGNLAFDDVTILSYTTIDVNENLTAFAPTIFPTISENGIFTIHNSQFAVEGVEVYNAVGEKGKRFSGEIKWLNLSDLPAGIYFIKLTTEAGTVTKKIVIAK